MSIISIIKQKIDNCKKAKIIKRKAVILAENEDKIQIREFEGATYISVSGIPLIKTDSLKDDIYKVLKDARNISSNFIIKKL